MTWMASRGTPGHDGVNSRHPHVRQRRHPVQPRFCPEARRRRRGAPRRSPRPLQQPVAVHLHRHGELHRRPRQRRDHRSRSRQRGPRIRAARRRARRNRHAYLRHPHPPRPFAEHRADQGGHRRHRLCRGAAPRVAAVLRERENIDRVRRRPRFSSRRAGEGRRDHRRRRLGAAGGGDAGPYRQPHGVRVGGAKIDCSSAIT